MTRGEHSFAVILRLALAVAAAVVLFVAGHDMRGLASEAGDSVAEAFDHAVGLLCYGLALGCLALAIPAVYGRSADARRGVMDDEDEDNDR